jgi:hypothetical protein
MSDDFGDLRRGGFIFSSSVETQCSMSWPSRNITAISNQAITIHKKLKSGWQMHQALPHHTAPPSQA